MSTNDIPQWAHNIAANLAIAESEHYPLGLNRSHYAFARYIADHEEAPVDPLLIEAREIVANEWAKKPRKDFVSATATRDGVLDDGVAVRSAIAALKRGIEIGNGGAS